MIKILLKNIIAELCIDVLFSNLQRNLAPLPPPNRRVTTPSAGDCVWLELSSGEQQVGEVVEVDASGLWMDILDTSIADTIVLYYKLEEIMALEILDVEE